MHYGTEMDALNFYAAVIILGLLRCLPFQFCCSLIVMSIIVRPPGTLVPGGLMFYCRCFLFFFRHTISELPRPIAAKLCHMIAIWVRFIMQVQKFRGSLPPKKLGAKNMQNSARFQTTSDFNREYLRNGTRYPKLERRDDQRFLPRSTEYVR